MFLQQSFLLPLQESLPDVMDKVPNATFDEAEDFRAKHSSE